MLYSLSVRKVKTGGTHYKQAEYPLSPCGRGRQALISFHGSRAADSASVVLVVNVRRMAMLSAFWYFMHTYYFLMEVQGY